MHIPRIVSTFLLRPTTSSRSISSSVTLAQHKMSEGAKSSENKTRHRVRYDLYRGHPNMQMLPQDEMKTIMSSFLNEDGEKDSWGRYLNYGPNAGDERFRLALRSLLGRRTKDDDMGRDDSTNNDKLQHNDGCDHELFITNGVSHGLELLCGTCTNPGDEVWVERPTYFLAPKIFESNNLVVKSLPMMSDRKMNGNERGEIGKIDIDRLICMVEEEGVPTPKMMYIIPSYHNPTGRSMTVDERKRLASFALRNGVILVADEVYHLLDWEQKSDGETNSDSGTSRRPAGIVNFNSRNDDTDIKPSVQAKDKDRVGCCVSVSSFTKIFGPGIRLGWIDAPSFIIDRLKKYGYIDSQGGVAPFVGRMMTHAIENNLLDSYLDKLKLEYSERYDLMCSILRSEPQISILTQNYPLKRRGGYFIWVGFPPNINSDDFLKYSLENFGVRFMAGTRCDPFALTNGEVVSGSSSIKNCARLCFADLDRDDLMKGTTAFVEAFQSYMSYSCLANYLA